MWQMIKSGEMPPENQPDLSSGELQLIGQWLAANTDAMLSPDLDDALNEHDVLPIMLLRCTTCHGARKKEGGLDLRTLPAMHQGGKSGPALVPGNPAASLMITRVETEACPPRELLLKLFIKRPSSGEVAMLRRWISAGAPAGNVVLDIATTQPDLMVSDADRQHWAFQAPQCTSAKDSIDAFLLDKLHEVGLEFSPEADRDTLIRRAYIDLIGMPPSHSEWQHWHHCEQADWYSEMVEHLLASTHYGERWGRYWLDLAGYADSEGGISADPLREHAWKYRDYVVRSFNLDKPYDRFLIQQLAGDELLDHAQAEVVTQEMVDNLIATGFLRMGVDQTGSRTMNFVPERLGVISDAITVVGEGLMGLTLGCARCHSHKYDAIPHRDYYRFKAIFQGALDEHDWLTFKNRELSVDTAERVQRVNDINPPLAAKVKQLESQLKKAETAVRLELLRQHYPNQSESDREETLRALQIADNNRSLPQRMLVEMLQTVEVLPDEQQPAPVRQTLARVAEVNRELRAIRRQMEPALAIRALWDRGAPSPTYILRRGEHDKPGRLVGPGVPSVLTDGQTPFLVEPPFPHGSAKTGRRLAFARWLTRDEHPLTARVMVNRIWFHHFGTGIVTTLENFGSQGERPSHPELLDWLAVEFVKRDWSIKAMHRLIMNSRAYRQESRISPAAAQLDSQNRLLSHMPMRRMNAEAVRDSILSVSGRLDARAGGPPDEISVDRNGLVSIVPSENNTWRRSLYSQYRRTEIPTLMETFDYPEMGPNCLARNTSIVAPQPLMLMNNAHIYELAQSFAAKIDADTPQNRSAEAKVLAVYEHALSRSASDEELEVGIAALEQLAIRWQGDQHKALHTYCHTILNSAAFLFVD